MKFGPQASGGVWDIESQRCCKHTLTKPPNSETLHQNREKHLLSPAMTIKKPPNIQILNSSLETPNPQTPNHETKAGKRKGSNPVRTPHSRSQSPETHKTLHAEQSKTPKPHELPPSGPKPSDPDYQSKPCKPALKPKPLNQSPTQENTRPQNETWGPKPKPLTKTSDQPNKH